MFVLLLWRLLQVEENRTRLAMVAASALTFLTIAIPLQFENGWMTIGLALEAMALTWLYQRIPHRGLLAWSGGLAFFVMARFVIDPVFDDYRIVYLVCAATMFVAAWLAPGAEPALRRVFASAGAIQLFFLLNILIADYYSPGPTPTFNFISSSLAQELTYTIGWALFAIAMLVTGLVAAFARGAGSGARTAAGDDPEVLPARPGPPRRPLSRGLALRTGGVAGPGRAAAAEVRDDEARVAAYSVKRDCSSRDHVDAMRFATHRGISTRVHQRCAAMTRFAASISRSECERSRNGTRDSGQRMKR